MGIRKLDSYEDGKVLTYPEVNFACRYDLFKNARTSLSVPNVEFHCGLPWAAGNQVHDTALNLWFPLLQPEQYVKRHIVRVGAAQVWRSGEFNMTGREEYLLRAAELDALAQVEQDPADRLEFENLARAYLRLAKQAERNSQIEIVLRDAARKGA